MIAVVGGGVSGMAAAWLLERSGHAVEVIERDVELAGRSQSATLGDRVVTLGGKNIGRRYELFREFTGALGDNPYEPFGINASPVIDGEPRTFDSERRMRSFAKFARDATPGDALRFARLAVRARRHDEDRFLGSPYFARIARRSDHEPLSGHFSERLAANVLRAVTVRMNGAEPDEVWLGNLGSNLGMLLDSYDQLTHGMARVADQFAARFTVRSGTEVRSLIFDPAGAVRGVEAIGPVDGSGVLHYDGVVLAMPADAAARLVGERHPRLAARLGEIRYFPGAVVLAEYDRPVFTPALRALAFPAGQPLSNAGAYGIEDRHIVRYTFSGAAARPHLAHFDPEALLAVGEAAVGAHLPLRTARRLRFAARAWPTAYCAYAPNHDRWRVGLDDDLSDVPGLHLTGDYLRGVSIEACFRAARDCVASVREPAPLQSERVRALA